MITAALLRQIMLGLSRLRSETAAPALEAARLRWGIGWGDEAAHWLAQLAHESGQLVYTREIASGEAYEGRRDLGNTQPGDGKRFRGRGYIQLTGRDAYTAYSRDRGIDFVAYPERLEEVENAADVSGWFWKVYKNDIWQRTSTARDRVLAITRIVNGGTNGLEERRHFYALASKAIGAVVEAPSPIPYPPIGEESSTAPSPAVPPVDVTPEPPGPPVENRTDAGFREIPESSAPSGESPEYGEKPMPAPLLIAAEILLPKLLNMLPWFSSGSEVANRNIDVAKTALPALLEAAKAATGQAGALEAVDQLEKDPAARQTYIADVAQKWPDVAPFLEFQEKSRDAAAARAEKDKTVSDLAPALADRAFGMMAGAIIGVLLLIAGITYYTSEVPEMLVALLITLVSGIGQRWGAIYDYRFGSSAGSKASGDVVRDMATKNMQR